MRDGVKETYRGSHSELRVRFPVLHPVFLSLLLVLFSVALSPSTQAIDVTYAVENDVTLYEAVSDELGIQPYVVYQYSPFGFKFTYDDDSGLITSSQVNSLRRYWSQLTTGDKAVATALLDMMLSVDSEFQSLEAQVKSTNTVYGATQVSSGITGITTDTPNLLGLITQNQKSIDENLWRYLQNHVHPGYNAVNGDSFSSMGVADLLGLVSTNQRNMYLQADGLMRSGDWQYVAYNGDVFSNLSVGQMLASMSWFFKAFYDRLGLGLFTQSGWADMLYWDGTEQSTPADLSLTQLTKNGFMGLGRLLAGSGDRAIVMNTVDPDNPLADGGTYRWPSLFDYLGYMGEEIQRDLTKLQYVLANDQDIEMSQQEQPNKDAVYDEFFGDGAGAVKPNDISDAAGLAGNVKDSFSGAGSAGDAFVSINDTTNYSFFSQEVANALDTVGQPSLASEEDFMDAFQADENGFFSLADSSFFSLDEYLKGWSD